MEIREETQDAKPLGIFEKFHSFFSLPVIPISATAKIIFYNFNKIRLWRYFKSKPVWILKTPARWLATVPGNFTA